ncbi:MAG TPA: Flp family type IVb pilin [Candidatus Dormibacteraeota bacterium]|nr:Flp family type IVb pilin [Candidatus Dormibacteraeota bacterium]
MVVPDYIGVVLGIVLNTFFATSKKGGRKVTWESRGQGGQGMVEYALILVLVSIVVIVILLSMGQQIANVFSNVVAALGA